MIWHCESYQNNVLSVWKETIYLDIEGVVALSITDLENTNGECDLGADQQPLGSCIRRRIISVHDQTRFGPSSGLQQTGSI
jgi:hypothetical protein